MSARLDQFLQKALAHKAKIELGQFELVNMAAVREQAGEKWAKLRPRIMTAGAQFIEHRIGPDNAVIPCEEGFLVIFADGQDDHADRVATLGEELMRFFFGEPDLARLKVKAGARRVDAREVAELAAPRRAGSAAVDDGAPRARFKPGAPAGAATEDGARIPYFRPVWDAQKQAVCGNAALTRIVVGGRAIDGRRAISTRMARADQAELDLTAQKAAFDALMRAVRDQSQSRLFLAIHRETWDERDHRTKLMERFEGLPEPVRRAFWVRLDGYGDDVATMADALEAVAATGVSPVADLPFASDEMAVFAGRRVSAFSCATRPPANSNSEGLMPHDSAALNTFVRAAQTLGARTYLHDVRDLHTLKAAMACGVRFFSGASVAADGQRPVQPAPLSIVDIYRAQKAA